MKGIYERAVAVLVIDREFEVATASFSTLEKTLMIATSLWWTRMWTLQEGIFARRLFFQLGKRPVTLQSLASARDADETPAREDTPSTRASIKLYLTGDLIRSLSLQTVSGPVLSLMQGRSTYNQQDELCASVLATVLVVVRGKYIDPQAFKQI